MNTQFHLTSLGADSSPALTLGQGYPKEVNGIPAFYYWRKSAKDGNYVHPTKGFELCITPERRKKWEDNFRAMRAANVDVPVIKDHLSSTGTLGYVVDVRQNGEWYEELQQYLGAEAKDIALKNRISIGIDPSFKDGHGKQYGECVYHSATTPIPVIPGTGDAEPLLASRAAAVSDVFLLAAHLQGSADMALLEKLREVFGASDLTEETALAKVTELKASLDSTKNDLKLSREAHDADKEKLTTAEGKVVELSREPAAPDPEALMDRADLSIQKIELSMQSGDLPVTIGKKLVARVKPDGKPNTFMLSRAAGIDTRPVDFIVDLFKDSKLGIQSGSKTGVQVLSRQVPGDDEPDPKEREAFIKERAARVSAAAAK